MLESNLVNFLGSDAHREKSIYTHLKSAINKVKSIVDKEKFDEITHFNPMKVIKDEILLLFPCSKFLSKKVEKGA